LALALKKTVKLYTGAIASRRTRPWKIHQSCRMCLLAQTISKRQRRFTLLSFLC